MILISVAILTGAAFTCFLWGWDTEQQALANMRADVWDSEPIGGEAFHNCLGPAGWVTRRATTLIVLPPTTDVQFASVRRLHHLTFVSIQDTDITDAGIEYLRDLPCLKDLGLNSHITDAGLAPLKGLPLEELFLSDKITDAGLAQLTPLRSLHTLHLGKSKVTDAGLAHLADLDAMERLYLQDTLITDAGLIHLRKMKHLQYLALSRTRITDAGLLHLKALKDLELLYIKDTEVTAAGLKDLKSALPRLRIDQSL